uniref:Cytochrome P450 n=1 Tax=Oryza punctata TaxID=4537 RepID=A0A0E0M608_ORYPU
MEGIQLLLVLLPVAQGANYPCIALVTAGMAVLATAWLVIRLVFVKGTNTSRGPWEADGMRLVPGSRGLPIIGETLEFLTQSPSLQLPAFFKRRLDRYGPLFKTNMIMEDLIVSLDPEVSNFVLQQEERLFQMWYPDSFLRIIGADSLITTHGLLDRHIKNLALRLFGPENLRREIIQDVQKTVEDSLSSWLNHPSIELKEAVSSMIFSVTAKKLISYDSSTSDRKMWKQYDAFTQGLLAFPLCIPGTAFYKCMQGRKNVIKMLKEILNERKKTEERHESIDFFDVLIEEVKAENAEMTENTALDLLFLLLFASFETTSSGITAMLRFLTDNPEALHELIEEHNNIRKRRADKNTKITWEEYKSMKFTSHVIHEALRLASIAPVMFREAIEDVHIKGFAIPKGSKIMICPYTVHLNPVVYKDPSTFNPWRWKDIPEPAGGASKDFMAFGGGLRLCVGAHFAKLQMAVFLHCLVTKYSWKAIKGERMALSPGLRFPEGFRIQLFPKA